MDQLSSTRGSSRRSLVPRTILFLAANPVELQPLQLGEECRAIEDGIRAATFREQIRFCSRWAARLDDLMQVLNEHSQSVLHFCGHGDGAQGLCFQSENGGTLSISADGLTRVIEAAGTSVAVIVLNACYSELQAQALVSCVPCVIGASSAISDKDAIAYAAAFYGALAYGKSVANAHQQGTTAVQLHRNGVQAAPSRDVNSSTSDVGSSTLSAPNFRLLTRPDTDADSIYIAGGQRPTSRCTIIIKATVSECTGDVLARITDELRELTGDVTLEIKYLEEGSVRLTVTLTPEAARQLLALKVAGKLERVGGFEVSRVIRVPEAQVKAQLAVERQRIMAKYRQDRQVVCRTIDGGIEVEPDVDMTVLESICVANEPALMRTARRLAGNDADACDLVQDTFMRAMRRSHRLVNAKDHRAWLFTVLTNTFLNELRGRAQHTTISEPHDASIPGPDAFDEKTELDQNSRISEAQIRDAVKALPPELAEVVALCYFQQMSYREVAEVLNVPISTVATRTRRARLRLKELMRAAESRKPTTF